MPIESELVPFVPLVGATLHPFDGALQERVLRAIIGREDTENTAYPPLRVGNDLERGRIARAAADLPKLSDPRMATCQLARASSLGTPVPDSVARSFLEPSVLSEDSAAGRLACAGVYLADQGRSDELEAILDRLRTRARRAEGHQGEDRNAPTSPFPFRRERSGCIARYRI